MLEQFRFYWHHSLNDLWVNRRRTLFAILCIAAGVAAIVSLQTVATMIGDTLTTNLQESNRSDIKVRVESSFARGESAQPAGVQEGVLEEVTSNVFGQRFKTYRLGEKGLARLQGWIDENYPGEVTMTAKLAVTDFLGVFTSTGPGTAVSDTTVGTEATQATPVLIDPKQYPYYGEIRTEDGQALADVLREPTDVVLDKKLAEELQMTVGDTVRVSGANADFVVRGIVPTEAEVADPFSDFITALFGFYYLDQRAVQYFDGVRPQSEQVFFKLEDPAKVSEVNAAFMRDFPYLTTRTTADLAEQNQEIAGQVNQLVTVMGLVSMLLGSIGIVNTMQVIVRRRTVEVAVLKTLGLQANQVTILFLVEAFMMGVVGSLAGILLGWATTFVIKGVAESLVAQPLTFRIAVGPVINGAVVGVLVTTIFGFLPTLAAGQVRPAVVLRPNDEVVPRAGCLRTVLALVVIVVAVSLVAQTIIGSFVMALAVTVGAFVAAGFLFALLSVVIWLVGRFLPSLGSVDLRISLRQMLAGRSRAASTLLALVVGVFSLSLITLLADSVNNLLKFTLSQGMGGNVIVTVAAEPTLATVEEQLRGMEGVEGFGVVRSYQGFLVGVDKADGSRLDREQLKARIQESLNSFPFANMSNGTRDIDLADIQLRTLGTIAGRQIDQIPDQRIKAGRALDASDAGKAVLVLEDQPVVGQAGLQVGDRLTYRFGDGESAPEATFEIVGIAERSLMQNGFTGNISAPYDALPAGVRPSSSVILADVADASIPEVRRQLGRIPGTFVIEAALFQRLISGLLGTFTAFPTMVALLGLIVGGVVIANSVALTTMERKREIAIMKAVGLQRERVLGMLLLENGLLGLIGGLIGVGIGLVGLVIALASSGGPAQAIPFGAALMLMALCIAVALIAALTTAWGASGEKPLTVLRYE